MPDTKYNEYNNVTVPDTKYNVMPIVVTPWRAELFYDGKLVFVALVMMVLWGLVKVMRQGAMRQRDSHSGLIAPMIFCCIVGYLVQAFFNITVPDTKYNGLSKKPVISGGRERVVV